MTRIASRAVCLVSLLACATAPAANVTWISTSSTDFNSAANWTGGTPNFAGYNDLVNFTNKGTLVDPALTADASVLGISIGAPGTGKGWQIGVPGSVHVLHVGTGGVTCADSSSATNSLSLVADAPQPWSFSAASGGITFNGALSGTGRVTKTGAGIFRLYSTNAAAFSGGITLQAGQVLFTNGSVFGTAPIQIAGSCQLTPNASGLVVTNAVQVVSPATLNFGTAAGAVGAEFSGPWTLNRALFCRYDNSSGSSANLKLSGSMVGPGGILDVQTTGAAVISLTGTPKRFTGPIIAGTQLNAGLDVGTATTPGVAYVRLLALPFLASPLQVSSGGTLGSGPVEIQAGGLSIKAATCLAANSSVRILRSPYHMGFLSVQYNGALPSSLDLTNSTGFIALDTAYSTAIAASLSNLFLGATVSSTYSAASLATGSGNTWRLGAGGSTLTLDATATAGALTGAGNSLVVGMPGARLLNVNRGAGYNFAAGNVSLADDNDFGGSITVNNNSTLIGAKPVSSASLSPLGANGTDKSVTLEGGYLRLDNTTAGTNGLAVSKGALTVAGRSLLGVSASATRTATLTFDSLAFDSVNGGALFLNDGTGTSLGNYGRIKVTSQAATNLVSPRILGGSFADFLQYDASSGLIPAVYAVKGIDFTPVPGEITKTTNSLTMTAGTLQALHLSKGTVTNSGTLNISSGGLSADGSANANTLTNGTIHFGDAGDNTVEGFVGVRCDGTGNPISIPFFLHAALDGGNGVTFFGISDNATVAKLGGAAFLDGAPTNQAIAGSIKVLDNMSVGFKYSTTRNLGPTGAGAMFPYVTNLLFNGGRLLLSDNNGSGGAPNITIGQTVAIGPHGAAFVSGDSAGVPVLTLNGSLLGNGPLTIDGGGNSTFTIFAGNNSGFSGDVVIGGGTHSVTNNSSLGTGNVLVKLGSGAIGSKLYLWSDGCIAANRTLGLDVDPASGNSVWIGFRSASPAIGSLEGSCGFVNLGQPVNGGTTTLTIGGDNRDTFYAGTIQDFDTGNSKCGALVKTGSGALTLLGTCNYTRGTTINTGAIFVDGIMTNSSFPVGAVTVNSGATFGGYGQASCAVTNKAGSLLAPGHNAPGTLTLGSLALENNSVALFELGAAGSISNDLVVVSGNLALNSGHTIRLSPLAGFGTGTYTLFTYGGLLSGTPSVEPVAGWVVKTSTGSGLVQINVSRRNGSVLLFR
jgi:autotransporter-associated beta strand protein